jgi:hypothetical protein
MPDNLSHEEIAARFLEYEAIDFAALGRFVSEIGRDLVVRDQGWHGVNFGRFNLLACMLTATDAIRLVGGLRAAGLTATALEGGAEAG